MSWSNGDSFFVGALFGVLLELVILALFSNTASSFVARGKPYCESATLGGQEIRKCWRAVEVPAE